MAVAVRITLEDGAELTTAYIVRIGGWTEERYFREAPESRYVEFEDGELIVHSPAGILHQRIVRFLTILLQSFVERHGLGEVLNGPAVLRLRPGLNYEPDLFLVPSDQRHGIGKDFFAGIPALIVEVLSEGTRTHDLRAKASAYRAHGVLEYWAIDPARRILVRHVAPVESQLPFRLTEQAEGRLESAAVPGFWLDVAWLWQDPPPNALDCLHQILPA